jgi:hypothetical protein
VAVAVAETVVTSLEAAMRHAHIEVPPSRGLAYDGPARRTGPTGIRAGATTRWTRTPRSAAGRR